MWIVLALAGLVLVFAQAMRVELAATANEVAGIQAEYVAQGALAYVLSRVDGTDGSYQADSECTFEAVAAGDGFFWVLCPRMDDDAAYSFGIRDEAGRINVNTATQEMLVKLPGMTAEAAAAIVDWRDEDEAVSTGGAESEYYLLLPDPYYCKNAFFETLEELLLVKGISREMLYGEDLNRNGVLDFNENDADESEPADNRDGHLARGLADYVTVYSRENNLDSQGEARINVNDGNAGGLSDVLRGAVSTNRYFGIMDRVRSGRPFRNVLDFYYRTGLTTDEFAQVADALTTRRSETVAGLVNVATAPREVLLCLPGLEESDVDALVEKRQASDTDTSNIAWVAEVLDRDKGAEVGDFVTARSYQFSADIVAVSANGRAFRRYLAEIDALSSPARVTRWQDLTALGWPLDESILNSIRAGETPEATQNLSTGGA